MKPLVHGVTLAALFCAAGAQAAPRALIPLSGENRIEVIDTETHMNAGYINLAFTSACGVAFDPSRHRIYFAEFNGDVHEIDSDTLAVVGSYSPPVARCDDIAASPDGGVYLAEGSTLHRVDVESKTRTDVGTAPGAIKEIEVGANGGRVYVSMPSDNAVGYFENNKFSTDFSTQTGRGIGLTGDGRYLYGAPGIQSPSRIDVQTGATPGWNYPANEPAFDVAVSANGDRVFVLTRAGEVHAVDPDNGIINEGMQNQATVTGLTNADALSLTPDGSHLYAVSQFQEKIYIVAVDALESGAYYNNNKKIRTLNRRGQGKFVQWVSDFIEPVSPATAVAVDPTSGGQILFTAVEKEGIYRSTDGGASWDPANGGASTANGGLPTDARERVRVLEFSADGKVLFAATAAGVYKTIDGGQSWKSANSGLDDLQVTDIQVVSDDGEDLFVSTEGGGVYKSSSGGEGSTLGFPGWLPVNQGLPL